jgi:predicted DNA-binding transcriptional regulator AlpA
VAEPLVVAAAEIVQMLDVKRARVFQLIASPEFPAPVATLGVGKVWLYKDVVDWARRTGRTVHPIAAR